MNNKHNGSVLLSITGIAATSSIAIILVLLAVNALGKTINLTHIQHDAQRLLKLNRDAILSKLIKGIDFNLLPVSEKQTITYANIKHTISTKIESPGSSNTPLIGFSIKEHFYFQHVRLISQANNKQTQSAVNVTGLACIKTINGFVENTPDNHNEIDLWNHSTQTISYVTDEKTGQLWQSEPKVKLIIDHDLQPGHKFSPIELVFTNLNGRIRLAIIYLIHHPARIPGNPGVNKLYILFDEPYFETSSLLPLNENELVEANNTTVFNDEAPGYVMPLEFGNMNVVSMATLNHKLFFITQQMSTKPGTQINYANRLIRIDLKSESDNVIQAKHLLDSSQALRLKVNSDNQAVIEIGTQFENQVFIENGGCKKLYQYEK